MVTLWGKSPEKRTTAPTHHCQFMQANEVAKETTKMAQQSDQLQIFRLTIKAKEAIGS
jgi:hypothetical protein